MRSVAFRWFIRCKFTFTSYIQAHVELTLNDGMGNAGATVNVSVTKHDAYTQDGKIDSASAVLGFTDVFNNGGTVCNGFLDVDFSTTAPPLAHSAPPVDVGIYPNTRGGYNRSRRRESSGWRSTM